jgi:hypothetical protein
MRIYFQLATVNKGNNSITKYFQMTKTLSNTLAVAGQPLNDFESVSFLLKGLGTEFDPFVTSVTTRVDPLSFDELYGHLMAHEMLIDQQLPSIDLAQPSANYASLAAMQRGRGYRGRGSSSGGRTYFRGRGASFSNRGRGTYFNNDATPSSRHIGQFCSRISHTIAWCYQRLKSAHSFESQQQHPQAYQQNPQAYYSSPALPTEENWYPDTTESQSPMKVRTAQQTLKSEIKSLERSLDGPTYMTTKSTSLQEGPDPNALTANDRSSLCNRSDARVASPNALQCSLEVLVAGPNTRDQVRTQPIQIRV